MRGAGWYLCLRGMRIQLTIYMELGDLQSFCKYLVGTSQPNESPASFLDDSRGDIEQERKPGQPRKKLYKAYPLHDLRHVDHARKDFVVHLSSASLIR